MIAIYSLTGAELHDHTIHHSMSHAEDIGRTIRELKETAREPIDVLTETFDGFHLFHGKVIDVFRRTRAGFARGEAKIEGLGAFDGHELSIKFQNEFLIAQTGDEVLASAPDLISIIESETGEPVTTEELKYGYRIDVLGLKCADHWRTPEGIALGGPAFFDYDIEYVPIEDRVAASEIARGAP